VVLQLQDVELALNLNVNSAGDRRMRVRPGKLPVQFETAPFRLALTLSLPSPQTHPNMQPEKRKRTEDGSDDPDPIRSDIWFADGSIIIQAERTQFRVHQGTLSACSEVLKAALDSMGETKGVEGCPLLCVPDSSINMAYLLRAIFYRWYECSLQLILYFMRIGVVF
jgi:hypothetical protein